MKRRIYLKGIVGIALILTMICSINLTVTGTPIERFDMRIPDNEDDVIDSVEEEYTDDYPKLDILFLEANDNGHDKVVVEMTLAAKPYNLDNVFYSVIIGDFDANITTMGMYSNGVMGYMYPYPNDDIEIKEIYINGDKIVWTFDREKLGNIDKFDIMGMTYLEVKSSPDDEEFICDITESSFNVNTNGNEVDYWGLVTCFGGLAVIIVIILAVIIRVLRKNKKHQIYSQYQYQYQYQYRYPYQYQYSSTGGYGYYSDRAYEQSLPPETPEDVHHEVEWDYEINSEHKLRTTSIEKMPSRKPEKYCSYCNIYSPNQAIFCESCGDKLESSGDHGYHLNEMESKYSSEYYPNYY